MIVRNLHFRDAYDQFPAWDPLDGAQGNWNSDYDNLGLRGATRVWIDHCTFDDGDRPDDSEPQRFGRPMQRHDGLRLPTIPHLLALGRVLGCGGRALLPE